MGIKGSKVDYLRISVTDRCNYNCIYCHREGDFSPGEELPAEKILKIAEVARKLGFKRVKLTGGEPLLRKDLPLIIRGLKELGYEDVSLVTNGYLLDLRMRELSQSGLDRINVSLPSLNPKVFKSITRCPQDGTPLRIVEAVKKAKSLFKEVKINVVVLKGLNHYEVFSFIKLSSRLGVPVQFIELQAPQGYDMAFFAKHYMPLDRLEELTLRAAKIVEVKEDNHKKRISLANGAILEFVRPMFNPEFCRNCRKLRLTSDGFLKPCLMRSNNHVPIRDWSEEGIKRAILRAIELKEPYFG